VCHCFDKPLSIYLSISVTVRVCTLYAGMTVSRCSCNLHLVLVYYNSLGGRTGLHRKPVLSVHPSPFPTAIIAHWTRLDKCHGPPRSRDPKPDPKLFWHFFSISSFTCELFIL